MLGVGNMQNESNTINYSPIWSVWGKHFNMKDIMKAETSVLQNKLKIFSQSGTVKYQYHTCIHHVSMQT